MGFEIFESDRTAITETIVLTLSPARAHSFAGIRYFNASGTQVTPTAGTVLIEARHVTNNMYSTVVRGTLDATRTGVEAEWGGNASSARATPTGIAGNGVTTYQLVVVQNDD